MLRNTPSVGVISSGNLVLKVDHEGALLGSAGGAGGTKGAREEKPEHREGGR